MLSQLAATAIPIPGLIPCHPPPPSHPHHAPLSVFSASASETCSQAGTSDPPPYQISTADLVTVASFKPSVHVMSTKTRPKRIGIVGSDGRTYTFLLKVNFAQRFTHNPSPSPSFPNPPPSLFPTPTCWPLSCPISECLKAKCPPQAFI